MRNWVMASLYTAHPSDPMLDFSAVYMGSRSMRAGINWLVFCGFNEGTDTLIVLLERIGVDKLIDGRLRAAGLISTILTTG